jgi:hypothetical protein
MEIQTGNIGLTIQLAIAPALLLAGIATHIRVLANRLGRIVDRRRVLEEQEQPGPLMTETSGARREAELDILFRRMDLVHRAMTLDAISALLVSLVIVALFLTDVFDIAFDRVIAALFILSMTSLIASFLYFLREIFLATVTLSVWLPKQRIRP